MGIQDEVVAALNNLNFAAENIHLETTQSGRIGGHIVSESFKGKTQKERQDELWRGLREQLKPDQLVKIVALLTVTPEEIDD